MSSDQLVLDDSEDAFINPDEAEEVKVNDDDVPMEDDDNDDSDGEDPTALEPNKDTTPVPDLSLQSITSHDPSSVFTVDSHLQNNNTLMILSGGGDDKAFLHVLTQNQPTNTVLLEHARTDSVSCVATNQHLVTDDATKTPTYIAVGCYDGSVVLYSATGEKALVLDGPTDVEFLSFHPKGGSVRFFFQFSLLVLVCGFTQWKIDLLFQRFYWQDLYRMPQYGCIIYPPKNASKCLSVMNAMGKVEE